MRSGRIPHPGETEGAEKLLGRADRAKEKFSLRSAAARAIVLLTVGAILCIHLGFPIGLAIIILSFEFVSQEISAYFRFLRSRGSSRFSGPDELLSFARRFELGSFFSASAGFISSAASAVLGYLLFNRFFLGRVEILPAVQVPVVYLAAAVLFFRAARLLPAYARLSLVRSIGGSRNVREASLRLYIANAQARAFDLFPPAVLLVSALAAAGIPPRITAGFSLVLVLIAIASVAELSRKS